MAAIQKELETSLTKLSLSTEGKTRSASAKKKSPVADSWDDDSLASSSEDEGDGKSDLPLAAHDSHDIPSAPPPTPISPLSPSIQKDRYFISPFQEAWGSGPTSPRSERDEGKRPEKTVAAASRMIAMGLGQRVPKRTEEQKAYDRAAKEKEIKRRNAEKEEKIRAQEDAARAKAAVWDD